MLVNYIRGLPKAEGEGWTKWVKGMKTYKLPVIKYISPGDIMYSMVTLVTLYCIWEVAKRVNLKRSHHKRNKFYNYVQ